MSYIMRLKTTLLAIAFAITFTSCSKDETSTSDNSVETNYTIDLSLAQQNDWAMTNEILVLVNAHRASIGLNELSLDKQYASAYAVEHTQYMMDLEKINHDNFSQRSEALKSRGAKKVGENVAFGYNTAETVVNAWLNSPGHKRAIEGEYTHSGFGVVKSPDNRFYFTQIFYKK